MEIIELSVYKNDGVLKCSHLETFKLIREKFSIKNPVYQQRRWQPRNYAITPAGSFQIGLWGEIEKYIQTLKIPFKIIKSEEFKQLYSFKIPISIENIEGFTYYDYQEDTIKEFLTNGRGISLLPTSAGKGLIIAGLCKSLLKYNSKAKILIVVPTTLLLHQLFKSIDESYGIGNVTRWGDELLPDWSQNIIIANTQILYSDIKFSLTKLQNYDYVIVDEVHTLGKKANKINKVIKNIKTSHKFGLTATLPDDIMAAWNVVGKIGPILYEKESYELRKRGNIANVEIKIIHCIHSQLPDINNIDPHNISPTTLYDLEFDFIINSAKRNEVIRKIVEKLPKNTLVMVDRIAHGQELEKVLQITGKRTFFVHGETETEDRTMITALMEQHDDIVVVGMSRIFSTGLSINNLHYVVFVTMGKSSVKTLQSIGRALRLHEEKDKSIIFDFIDNLQYAKEHGKLRMKMYKKEKIPFTVTNVKI